MIRVAIVDDQPLFSSGLSMLIEAQADMECVGTALDGEQGIALAARTHPDVMLMDLRMPGLDGLETTRRLRAERPGQQVVLYTAYLDAEIERQAVAAGAALCLAKVEGLPRLERELVRLTLSVPKRV